ncbi:MAG TPA: hypothetical protein VHG28_08410, partial [Longimicrobiaceae bacterium]|nr:hypothetical protein [Longimicrobiaceae bacterium]
MHGRRRRIRRQAAIPIKGDGGDWAIIELRVAYRTGAFERREEAVTERNSVMPAGYSTDERTGELP